MPDNPEGRIIKGKALSQVIVTPKRATKGITRGGYPCIAGKYRFTVDFIHLELKNYYINLPNDKKFKSSAGNILKLNFDGFWVERKDLDRCIIFIDKLRDEYQASLMADNHLNQGKQNGRNGST